MWSLCPSVDHLQLETEFTVADPDLQIRRGPDHPDPGIRWRCAFKNNFSRPFGSLFCLKIRWGPGPLGPSHRSATEKLIKVQQPLCVSRKNKSVLFSSASVIFISCWKKYFAGHTIFLPDEIKCRYQIRTNATEGRIFQFLSILKTVYHTLSLFRNTFRLFYFLFCHLATYSKMLHHRGKLLCSFIVFVLLKKKEKKKNLSHTTQLIRIRYNLRDIANCDATALQKFLFNGSRST